MDYSRIRGMDSGQRLSFEEMICQLARRESQAASVEFRRIEGAGGDGGIEAYWLLSDGSKIGYQAKFYLRSGDIDWANIDDSVERALQTHPELTTYVVAIPCDLTDKTGKQGRGKTGWEHWNARKAKWAALIPPGRKVDFVPWTAFELNDRLANPSAEGLRRFWFGDAEFSAQWFSDNVDFAVKSLDERYHPEDHVEVSIERIFKVALRDESVISELKQNIQKIYDATDLDDAEKLLGADAALLVSGIKTQISKLESLGLEITNNAWKAWPLPECLERLDEISDSVHKLQGFIWDAKQDPLKPKDSHNDPLGYFEHKLDKLSNASYSFRALLRGRYFEHEASPSILLYGRAGTGKSHLLGSIAQQAIAENRKAILILGQLLTTENIWSQITKRLGVGEINPDAFLQALSAAAEMTGKRGLILIDAINEGAGLKLWRNELAEFIARVARHKNLVLVISCRTEYKPYIITQAVTDTTPSYVVKGFETPEEQTNAARIYLGKRGISQPNTPWLSAEFVNPLFLRSACTALERDGKKWFPKGLLGTKQVFAFYLESIARNLDVGRNGTNDLVRPTNQALYAIALKMAEKRQDYLSHSDALRVVADKFYPAVTPSGISWLEVLQKNGLFRIDPSPRERASDPFEFPEEVVRFSFQRLQDYLMAGALLNEIEDPAEDLLNGSLKFIHDGEGLSWQWSGLAEALSVQLPELFDREFIDLLPGDINIWANDDSVRSSFIESLRWRSNDSFTPRTHQLYEAFLKYSDDYFDIIIQACASEGHPWNAQFLHRKLLGLTMPHRDAFWTVQVNALPLDEGSTLNRLITWSTQEQTGKTDPNVQYLCALTLTWLTSSSNRELRDKATKALTSLLLCNTGLYAKLCNDFASVDDLYIHERLHSAAFGACCIDPGQNRLSVFSKVAYQAVFQLDTVPSSILLRDSALGIIELAHFHGYLAEGVDIQKAKPPYLSKPIRLSVSEQALEKIAEKAGHSKIRNSCSGWGGDFASYEIRPRVNSFTSISLTNPEPMTSTERHHLFELEVIDHAPERSEILRSMNEFNQRRFKILFDPEQKPDTHSKRDLRKLKTRENELLELLSSAEKIRYKKEYQERFSPSGNYVSSLPHIDTNAAQRWVAKRAYGFGWTAKLFPHDGGQSRDYSRDRPLWERIGKKYQWLALDELLCGLADTKWMAERGAHGSRQYATPLDIGFHRDIDPTILVDSTQASAHGRSIQMYEITMHPTAEADIGKWPFEADPSQGVTALLAREGSDGRKWAVLHEHRSALDRYKDKNGREHGYRKQEWRFLLPVLVRSADEMTLIDYISNEKNIRVDSWTAPQSTDNGYLLEAPWRSTWNQEQWSSQYFHNIGEIDIAYPCFRYQWESHLDASLPEGAQSLVPAPWLAHRLGLTADSEDPNVYRDCDGEVRFVSGHSSGDGSHAFIDQALFESFLEEDGLKCAWIFLAERGAWPGGENEHASRRRSEGVVWHDRGEPKMIHWNDDFGRGNSERFVPAETKPPTRRR